jgi:hypothetical protein
MQPILFTLESREYAIIASVLHYLKSPALETVFSATSTHP